MNCRFLAFANLETCFLVCLPMMFLALPRAVLDAHTVIARPHVLFRGGFALRRGARQIFNATVIFFLDLHPLAYKPGKAFPGVTSSPPANGKSSNPGLWRPTTV
ncbi:hypothetical protein DFH09DRAFT_1167409 [Mycena vulgaris]|nr:hypothetical protein DFH09DRAFT_1167409 [Mycena vulgaris]